MAVLAPAGAGADDTQPPSGLGAPDSDGRLRVPAHQFEIAGLGSWREVELGDRERPVNDLDDLRDDAAEADDGQAGQAREDSVVLAGYRHPPSDARLAITRIRYPNLRAWRGEDSFFAEVEAGVAAAAVGLDRFHQRRQRLGRVPALDLGFRGRGPNGREVLLTRFLFFRRYTLALTMRVPTRGYRRHQRALRALVESFEPSFAP
ncbi:hypothetical protein [Haliangium sp.]|uniref:hypothetical protein n=1 Tax=Haliangium sp. TaxID=2663208 RepID=UPI003D0C5DBF